MPLLAYCVLEAASSAEKPASGVGGMEVEELQEGGLRCLFSGLASQEALSRLPAVESALAFHRTLQSVLTQATVIPFRFPTVVEDEEKLRRDLRENGLRYAEALARLREMVQMEVRISIPEGIRAAQQPASGREYLLGRQAQAGVVANAAQQFRQATREWVEEWREHRTGEGVRCYALVRRQAVAGFQEAAQALAASVPGARMSGPWPPAAFMEPEQVS